MLHRKRINNASHFFIMNLYFVGAVVTYQERVLILRGLLVQLCSPTTGPTTGCTGSDLSQEDWWLLLWSGKNNPRWSEPHEWEKTNTWITFGTFFCFRLFLGDKKLRVVMKSWQPGFQSVRWQWSCKHLSVCTLWRFICFFISCWLEY